ncbi:hypothetical protein GCM10027426_10790 [Microbacterium lacusdiani]
MRGRGRGTPPSTRALIARAPGRLTRTTAEYRVERWRDCLSPPPDGVARTERLGRDLERYRRLLVDIPAVEVTVMLPRTDGQILTSLPWRIHVEPRWGTRSLSKIRHSEVQDWVSEMARTQSASNVLRAHGILSGILDAAVKDRTLPSNVARDVALPRKGRKRKAYLTHRQVELLASTAREPDLVRFLAYTGVRWGEATGLRVRHLDLPRRRARVEENAVMVGTNVIIGTPKSHKHRSVPIPPFLLETLMLRARTRGRDDFVFGDGAQPMRLPNSKDGWFASSVRRAQELDPELPRVTPHDLRHTAASLAISAGANVKAVQRMLGHTSAAVTLDIYSDLFDDDLDGVSDALDRARTLSLIENPSKDA